MNHTPELLHQIKCVGIAEPVTEFKFHPKRRWRMDLAWPDEKLAVEIHGGVYIQGRHNRGKGFTNDREKMNEAQLLDWKVIEVTPEHIKKGLAVSWIERALNE